MRYRRPYCPRPIDGGPKPAAGTPPPVIGRRALPGGGRATQSVARFVAQVLILGAFGVFLARHLGRAAPELTRLLLGCGGASLALTSLLRWAFPKDGWAFPAVAVVGGSVAFIVLLSWQTPPSWPPSFPTPAFCIALIVVVLCVRGGHNLDLRLKPLNWGATAGLAGACLLLLITATLEESPRTLWGLGALALATNAAFGLALAEVHAGYVLAHPAHSHGTIRTETKFWREAFWGQNRFGWGTRRLTGAACVVACALVANLASRPPEPAEQPAGLESIPGFGQDNNELRFARNQSLIAIALVTLAACVALLPGGNRRLLAQAAKVWLLDDGKPTPGIYRPAGRLGSARTRQALFAAALFVNVLFVRTACRPLDVLAAAWLVGLLQTAEPSDAARIASTIVFALDALSVIAPLLGPVAGYLAVSRHLKQLYQRLEESTPESLYPR